MTFGNMVGKKENSGNQHFIYISTDASEVAYFQFFTIGHVLE